ncbi:MAG: TonB-dependent receptor plug domain-containing protein, partial [Alphaproteobacteria bacterium]|nr:TonB-dependent receptor plug domain-containing protein [Alphaproteobacteria bacterium]
MRVDRRNFGVRGITLKSAGSLAAGVVLLGLGLSMPGHAEDNTGAGARKPATETIMVTARKTAETLQEVPVTVSVVGGKDLARFNYDKIENLTTRIPTLNVQTGGSGSGAQVTLRGVGSSNISDAFDSAVALNYDGVMISQMRVLQSAFFDVQQVEVLKGPQSLYFGKSASAGVISIKSANPTQDWEMGAKASYEFEEQGYTGEAYVSGPLNDKVGVRLAARYNNIVKQYYNYAHD